MQLGQRWQENNGEGNWAKSSLAPLMGFYIQYFLGCWATAKWVTMKWHGTELMLIIVTSCWHKEEGLAMEPEVGDIPGWVLCIISTGNENWKLIPCLLFPSGGRDISLEVLFSTCTSSYENSSPEQGFQPGCSLGQGKAGTDVLSSPNPSQTADIFTLVNS